MGVFFPIEMKINLMFEYSLFLDDYIDDHDSIKRLDLKKENKMPTVAGIKHLFIHLSVRDYIFSNF